MNIFTDKLGHKWRIKDNMFQVCKHGANWVNETPTEYFVDVNMSHVPPEQMVDVAFTGEYGVLYVKARNVMAMRVPILRFRFD